MKRYIQYIDLPHNYNIVRELSRQLFCDEISDVGGNAQKKCGFFRLNKRKYYVK